MSRKILDYRIIKGTSDRVEAIVRELLTDGWTLNGELIPMKVGQNHIFAQGMILCDEGD